VSELPPEAERLLSVAPDAFVDERKRVATELREAGRADDAVLVAGLRKPTAVVLAVNRAARDRPQAARDAAESAVRVRETQLSGDQDDYRTAVADLDRSLDLLAEVAVAHVGGKGKSATGSMRQRVRDLLRGAVADDRARGALVRGALVAEQEASGFDSFAGVTVPTPSRMTKKAPDERSKRSARERERREREKTLKEELRRAERVLREAERSVAQAERERADAEKAVTAARGALERL
jgi:hypothetical protein